MASVYDSERLAAAYAFDRRPFAVGPAGYRPGTDPGHARAQAHPRSPQWHLWVDSLPPKGAIGWQQSGAGRVIGR